MILADAQIVGQQRLRQALVAAVATIWTNLPAYDEDDVEPWIERVAPIVAAAQRQSASLTDAYVARALERQPLGINPAEVVAGAVRNGTDPATQWRRPFVTVWTALGNGSRWEQATRDGLARATGMAAMDVQLTHRATLQAVQDADPRIRGYRRRADGSACSFCRAVNGAYVKSASAMALHSHCGCGLVPELTTQPATPTPETVAVHEHGELGAYLGQPGQHFTSEHQLH